MKRFCPFCNGDLLADGSHAYMNGCRYQGPGQTRAQILAECSGYRLGELTKGEEHNGAGCYDNDTDFS